MQIKLLLLLLTMISSFLVSSHPQQRELAYFDERVRRLFHWYHCLEQECHQIESVCQRLKGCIDYIDDCNSPNSYQQTYLLTECRQEVEDTLSQVEARAARLKQQKKDWRFEVAVLQGRVREAFQK